MYPASDWKCRYTGRKRDEIPPSQKPGAEFRPGANREFQFPE
jgi:hypothetical protein